MEARGEGVWTIDALRAPPAKKRASSALRAQLDTRVSQALRESADSTSGEPRPREQVHVRQVALSRFGNPFCWQNCLSCLRARGLHTHRHYLAPRSLVQGRIHG